MNIDKIKIRDMEEIKNLVYSLEDEVMNETYSAPYEYCPEEFKKSEIFIFVIFDAADEFEEDTITVELRSEAGEELYSESVPTNRSEDTIVAILTAIDMSEKYIIEN